MLEGGGRVALDFFCCSAKNSEEGLCLNLSQRKHMGSFYTAG